MNREQMISEVQRAAGFDEHDELTLTLVQARVILDVILPQATTVEEIQALPAQTVIIAEDGFSIELGVVNEADGWRRYIAELIREHGPFTVTWRPS